MRQEAFVAGKAATLTRRVISTDVSRDEELAAIAEWYVRTYEGANSFVRDLQRTAVASIRLTPVQLPGALNVYRREYFDRSHR